MGTFMRTTSRCRLCMPSGEQHFSACPLTWQQHRWGQLLLWNNTDVHLHLENFWVGLVILLSRLTVAGKVPLSKSLCPHCWNYWWWSLHCCGCLCNWAGVTNLWHLGNWGGQAACLLTTNARRCNPGFSVKSPLHVAELFHCTGVFKVCNYTSVFPITSYFA